ncbi:MAG: bacillithiol biosynthesis BshC [Candidatus Krumholzibacteriia bacterium]
MHVAERLQSTDLGAETAVAEAHVRGALPETLAAPGLRDRPARGSMSEQLLEELCAEMSPEAARAWRTLRGTDARVVVTGQQPGCVGGALLVLYKAATAVAVAQRATRRSARPVVPIFWNGTDDVDFDEIARVAWPDEARGLLFLELPRSARAAESFVGDLPAAGNAAAADAALGLVDTSQRRRLLALLPAAAADHGDWVARLLRAVFPDLAVLDARSPVLRRHAAPLFARYLQRHAEATQAIEATSSALRSAGFAPALSAASARTGLFLVADGQRRKVDGDLAPLREAARVAPESLSPNVILRPLVQDLLLPSIATIVGPSEIGYLLELRGLRRLLEVPEPALVPRLSLTVLDPGTWESALRLGLSTPALLANPDAALRRAARDGATAVLETIRSAFARLEDDLTGLVNGNGPASAVQRTLRRTRSLHGDLERQVESAALQELLAREPALATLRSLVRPRQKPQERVVAALWLLARWGADAGPRLVELAGTHLDALEARRAEHTLVIA